MIHASVKEILSLPDYYIDEYNATPMLNYWPLIEPIINVLNPVSVCEIGSERGLTTSHILESLDGLKRVEIVDPCISDAVKGRYSSDKRVSLNEEKSLEFFQRGGHAQLYFLDGDHNYSTLINELRYIEKNSSVEQVKCIFLHDVSWSWARRNMYYSPNDIDDGFEKKTETSLCLENENLEGFGFPSGNSYSIATCYGGERNGVLTAIEDYLEESDLPWEYFQIPSLWGLGILWLPSSLDDDVKVTIDEQLSKIESGKEFLGILEANRLRLLQGLNEWKNTCDGQSQSLVRLEEVNSDLYQTAEERLSEMNRLAKEREELFNVAEERLVEINRLGKEREELFNIAEERLVEINRLGKEREELFNVAEGRLSELQKFESVREEFERNVERLSISNEALENKLNTFEKSGFYKIFRFFNRT